MRKFVLTAVLGGLALTCPALSAAHAEVLISAAEAQQPSTANVSMTTRGMTRGPGVEQESPSASQGVKSPMPFRIKFEPRNSVPIDLSSVKLLYLKATPIDLTERIKKHMTATGIEMKDAEVPP